MRHLPTGLDCHCWILSLLLLPLLWSLSLSAKEMPRCFWVSSYAPGYEWNDALGEGIARVLAGKCELQTFHLDTKRNTSSQFGQQQANLALARIKAFKPQVVIASDDNASRYLVKPYLKNGPIPVVFCGINWSVDEYDYPYRNATGMVEFAPVEPLLQEVSYVLGSPGKALYLSSDVQTEHKDFSHYKKVFAAKGILLESLFATTLAQWEQGFLKAQEYDFVFLGNNAGINDWDNSKASRWVHRYGRKLSLSNNAWMVAYCMVAFVKIPQEQGEWAATVALELLKGVSPTDVPISPNRRWEVLVNRRLLKIAGIELRRETLHKAIKSVE